MKILTKEEEQAHYNETLKGGIMGGVAGLALGGLGVWGAAARFPAFRQLTLPLRAFLVTSSGTFAAIVSADSYSRSFERQRNPDYNYQDEQASLQQQLDAQKSTKQKWMDKAADNKYGIVFGSWVASMGIALGLVGRNPYLTGPQKLVQARVYAQGLTVAVVIASLAFETNDSSKGRGRWETVKILDPNDPTHKHVIEKQIHHESYEGEDQWRDMIAAEEEKIREREEAKKKHQAEHNKKNGKAKKPSKEEVDKAEDKAEKGKPEEAVSEKLNAP